MTVRRSLLALLAALPFFSLAPAAALAAAWPERPITIVVPAAAGGTTDIAARVLAEKMGKDLGTSVVVENKGGGGGSIGTAQVARARPDGYTLLMGNIGPVAINFSLYKQLSYKESDLRGITNVISVPNILVAAPSSPYNSLADFMNAARQKPGRLTYASYGPGSLAQMATELLKADAKFDAVHVPYKGGAPAIVDVMGGQVDVYFANAASSINYVKGGKLKALAVSSAKRMPDLPDVPTVAESGIKGFEVTEWNGFFLPAGTAPDTVQKLQDLVQKALALPATRASLEKLGLTPVGSSSAAFTGFVAAERKRWDAVVKANGITVQ
ncbi:MAG: tripartite tricarboxylate transporter substrate binding protein [Delftia acidovorans]|nr:tripartite tricarboxylate transporter substrate binding protein [Delftia acidovorans]